MARVFRQTIYVEPFGKQRPRATRGGIVYTPKETVSKEAEIRFHVQREWKDEPLSGPLVCKASFFLTRPESVSPKKRPYPNSKPDLDNLIKILDALNGIVWHDDKQIVTMIAKKEYADKKHRARIELEAYEL